MTSVAINPTSAPVRSVACRAVFRRSPSTRTSSRVESSPRSRGLTPNGPLPTGVMLATPVNASPVESGIRLGDGFAGEASRRAAGFRESPRSARAAVTVA